MPADLPPLAKALQRWRALRGLTQSAAADRLGVPRRSYERLESARSTATRAGEVAAGVIAELLG